MRMLVTILCLAAGCGEMGSPAGDGGIDMARDGASGGDGAGCGDSQIGDADAVGAGDLYAPDALGPVGHPCQHDSDCQTGECLTQAESPRFAGGYCTIKDCDPCQNTCPKGSQCINAGEGHRYCLKACVDSLTSVACRMPSYFCCGTHDGYGWCAPSTSSLCPH